MTKPEVKKSFCISKCNFNNNYTLPYTHTQKLSYIFIESCEKPSVISNEYNRNENEDFCGLPCLYYPCAFVLDIICCIPMCFGCYNVKRPY